MHSGISTFSATRCKYNFWCRVIFFVKIVLPPYLTNRCLRPWHSLLYFRKKAVNQWTSQRNSRPIKTRKHPLCPVQPTISSTRHFFWHKNESNVFVHASRNTNESYWETQKPRHVPYPSNSLNLYWLSRLDRCSDDVEHQWKSKWLANAGSKHRWESSLLASPVRENSILPTQRCSGYYRIMGFHLRMILSFATLLVSTLILPKFRSGEYDTIINNNKETKRIFLR